MRTEVAKVWRVRVWIRAVGVLWFLVLALEQFDIVSRVGRGEMPRTEVRDGYIFLAVLLVLVWRLAFHPRVTLDAGQVEVRNPLGRRRFATEDVQGFEMTAYGLRFQLADDRRPYTFIFQGTRYLHEPRWFDLAEAVTKRRSVLGSNQ